MRKVSDTILSDVDTSSKNGSTVDSGQLISASFHFILGDTTAAGTFKVQASNDELGNGNPQTFAPTNWVDIPSASVTYTAGTTQGLVTIASMAYRWVRAVSTITTPGSTTVTCNLMAFSV